MAWVAPHVTHIARGPRAVVHPVDVRVLVRHPRVHDCVYRTWKGGRVRLCGGLQQFSDMVEMGKLRRHPPPSTPNQGPPPKPTKEPPSLPNQPTETHRSPALTHTHPGLPVASFAWPRRHLISCNLRVQEILPLCGRPVDVPVGLGLTFAMAKRAILLGAVKGQVHRVLKTQSPISLIAVSMLMESMAMGDLPGCRTQCTCKVHARCHSRRPIGANNHATDTPIRWPARCVRCIPTAACALLLHVCFRSRCPECPQISG